jgi:hypothetical protein
MRNKSNFISALTLLVDFLSKLFKEIKKLGGNEETIYKAMNSDKIVAEIAKAIVGVKQTTSRILKYLELLNPKFSISSVSFSRDKFLASKLGVKVYLWDNFKNWIVPELSETIPVFSGNLASYKLTKNVYDKEIRAEIGEDQIFTSDEVLAIISFNISKQPNGEAGDFENTGYANIFYVRLKSGEVVALYVGWDSGAREWGLDSDRLGDGYWREDGRVFARS